MKRSIAKGTPEQFLNRVQNRIAELGGYVEACDKITASSETAGWWNKYYNLVDIETAADHFGCSVDDLREWSQYEGCQAENLGYLIVKDEYANAIGEDYEAVDLVKEGDYVFPGMYTTGRLYDVSDEIKERIGGDVEACDKIKASSELSGVKLPEDIKDLIDSRCGDSPSDYFMDTQSDYIVDDAMECIESDYPELIESYGYDDVREAVEYYTSCGEEIESSTSTKKIDTCDKIKASAETTSHDVDQYDTAERYYVYDDNDNVVSDPFEYEEDAREFMKANGHSKVKVHRYFYDESNKLRPDGDPEVVSTSIEASAETTYVDDNGIMGEIGDTWTVSELRQYWDAEQMNDPVLSDYDSFDSWLEDTTRNMTLIEEDEVVSAARDDDDIYYDRFIHTLIGDIQTELYNEVDGITVDVVGNSLNIVTVNDGNVTEFNVPNADLSFDFDTIADDVGYIVSTIRETLYPDAVNSSDDIDDDYEISEDIHDMIADTCWEIIDNANNILNEQYGLDAPAEYESREVRRDGNKITCTLWLSQLSDDTTIDITWSYRKDELVLNGSVESYGAAVAEIYAEDYGYSYQDIESATNTCGIACKPEILSSVNGDVIHGLSWSGLIQELSERGYKVDAAYRRSPDEHIVAYKDGKSYDIEVTQYSEGDYEIVLDNISEIIEADTDVYENDDINDDTLVGFSEIATKSVPDSNGFSTDYTMYLDTNTGEYVFVFGDKDIYSPEDGNFDWECETEEEAWEWFNSYNGFADDDHSDDILESTSIISASLRPGYFADRIFSILDSLSADQIERFLNAYVAWRDFDVGSISDIYDRIGAYLETSSGQQLLGDLSNYFEIDEVTTD